MTVFFIGVVVGLTIGGFAALLFDAFRPNPTRVWDPPESTRAARDERPRPGACYTQTLPDGRTLCIREDHIGYPCYTGEEPPL